MAALADELVEAAIAQEDVMAVDPVAGEDFIEVVARRTVERARFDPVAAFVAEDTFGVLVAIDEVIALTRKNFRPLVGAEEDEVVAAATEDQIETRTRMDDVIAVATLDIVVAASVLDDIVAGTAIDDIVAVAAFQPVRSAPSP